jgi:CheY-specific phosphatase CheX
MCAEVNEGTVVNASRQFWEQMLSTAVEASPGENEGGLSAGHMVGSVALSGAWNGRIEIRMSAGLAYEATAAMLVQSVESVVQADALDATKEIANMIAGVIKSSLPRPCTMTVPESEIEAHEYSWNRKSKCCLDVSFRLAWGEFLVSVLEQKCLVEMMPCG